MGVDTYRRKEYSSSMGTSTCRNNMEGAEVHLIRLRSTVAITTALSARDFPS